MLILSRKKYESIKINDDITITIVEIRGDKVRLGVEAPKEIPVHRQEVYNVLQNAQKCKVCKQITLLNSVDICESCSNNLD